MASAPQTANRYAYGLNNPLRYTDPSGHFVQSVIDHPGEVASLAVSFTFLPGLLYAGLSAILGYDPLTGRTLSAEERSIGFILLGAIPLARGLSKLIGAGARVLAKATGQLGRMVERLDGVFGRIAGRFGAIGRGMLDGSRRSQAGHLNLGALDDIAGAIGRRLGGDIKGLAAKVPTNRGRRGSPATQAHLDDVRDDFLRANPEWRHVRGGTDAWTQVRLREEYISHPVTGRQGAAYPDLTFQGPSGDRIRINTVDVLASGDMTEREWTNFQKIFELTSEPIIAIPKPW